MWHYICSYKGLGIDYDKGEDLQNGKITGLKLIAPPLPHSNIVKPVVPPPSKW